MKIKKFNEKFEYMPQLKSRIEHFGWAEEKIRYHIALPSDSSPVNAVSYIKLEAAIEELQRMNSDWDVPGVYRTYCLFESRIRVVPEEEIDLELKTNKYNL